MSDITDTVKVPVKAKRVEEKPYSTDEFIAKTYFREYISYLTGAETDRPKYDLN